MRVRAIFALYLRLGALLPTSCALNARSWTTKAGGAWSNTSLHAFLTSPLFAGKIRAGAEGNVITRASTQSRCGGSPVLSSVEFDPTSDSVGYLGATTEQRPDNERDPSLKTGVG